MSPHTDDVTAKWMQIANVPKGDVGPKINYIKIWPALLDTDSEEALLLIFDTFLLKYSVVKVSEYQWRIVNNVPKLGMC